MNLNLNFAPTHIDLPGENDFDIFRPKFWANEMLAILEENMVMAPRVHRDYEQRFQKFGDVVNVQRPAKPKFHRKAVREDILIQDQDAENVEVKLDQMAQQAFIVHDGDEDLSMIDLIEKYIQPNALAIASGLDRTLCQQVYRFAHNQTGVSGGLTPSNGKDLILQGRKKMNDLKVPDDGNRYGVLSTDAETSLLKIDFFTGADTTGDGGRTMRKGALGEKFNIKWLMDQNVPTIMPTMPVIAGALVNGTFDVGETVITIDGMTGAVRTGMFIDTAGAFNRIIAHTETTGNTTQITLETPLVTALADNAPLKIYGKTSADAMTQGAYAAKWQKDIRVDGVTASPQIGQSISFGTAVDAPVYSIVEVTFVTTNTYDLTLDRPLEADVADNTNINFGPSGNYNFVFHKNALALVIRPLSPPKKGAGALSDRIDYNGYSMRATIQYSLQKHGHIVNLDMLYGVTVLYPELGVMLVG